MRFLLAAFLVASAAQVVSVNASHGSIDSPLSHDIAKRASSSCIKTADCSNSIPANANRYCAAGKCSFRCRSGFTQSGNSCISPAACSTCKASAECTNTPPANANRYCNQGTCSWRCKTGFVSNGVACTRSGVIATTTSSAPAAPTCAKSTDCTNTPPANANRYCEKGVCSWRCRSGYTQSGSTCTRLATSPSSTFSSSAISSTTTSIAPPISTTVDAVLPPPTTAQAETSFSSTTSEAPSSSASSPPSTLSTDTTLSGSSSSSSTTAEIVPPPTSSPAASPSSTTVPAPTSLFTSAPVVTTASATAATPTSTTTLVPQSSSTTTSSTTTTATTTTTTTTTTTSTTTRTSTTRPAMATAPAATPVLKKTYTGTDFTAGEAFEFFTKDDPTHGLVDYVNASTAASKGLTRVTSSGAAILAIDSQSTLAYNEKRPSVRIESKETYDAGTLMLFDVAHMPWGCSTWPAMWTFNQPWPAMGEIDIVEGVSNRNFNQMTLHTVPGCTRNPSIPQTGLQNASWVGNDCHAYSWSYGCNVIDWDPASYGEGFNKAGGGVFALLFAETGISIWRWKRSDIPSDVKSGAPRWKTWGLPVAAFDGSTCDTRTFFQKQRITFDITTCGDMAGQDHIWRDPLQSGAGCYPKYGNCIAAVQDPENFKGAYFEVNYIEIYDV